jgi:hypothetical protein
MPHASYKESWEIESKLREMGLTSSSLHEAVKAGELYRSGCTLNDPKSLPGFLAWGRTIRSLRDILIPLGWERLDISNLPMVINRDKNIAIAVSSGDEATGNAAQVARTKYAKGRATQSVIIKNLKQLSLFDSNEDMSPPRMRTTGLVTWFLLVSRRNDEIYYELSLPYRIKDGKPVEDWIERIIFPPADFNVDAQRRGAEEDLSEEIVVDVFRKV